MYKLYGSIIFIMTLAFFSCTNTSNENIEIISLHGDWIDENGVKSSIKTAGSNKIIFTFYWTDHFWNRETMSQDEKENTSDEVVFSRVIGKENTFSGFCNVVTESAGLNHSKEIPDTIVLKSSSEIEMKYRWLINIGEKKQIWSKINY